MASLCGFPVGGNHKAIRAGTLMIRVRRVAQRVRCWSVATAARAMLNAITAWATQAALAAYFPLGRCASGPSLKFGDDLLDHRVAAVAFVGLDQAQGAVGDERVMPVGREQLALFGAVTGEGLESLDASHDQVTATCSALCRPVNAVKPISVTSASLTQVLGLVEDRVGVGDRRPGVFLDAGDRLDHGRIYPGSDCDPRLVSDRGPDERPPVVGRVRTAQDLPGDARPAGGGDGLGEQTPGAGCRSGVGRPQPGAGDHRRGQRGADRGQLQVQAADSGLPERRALLGVAVDRRVLGPV